MLTLLRLSLSLTTLAVQLPSFVLQCQLVQVRPELQPQVLLQLLRHRLHQHEEPVPFCVALRLQGSDQALEVGAGCVGAVGDGSEGCGHVDLVYLARVGLVWSRYSTGRRSGLGTCKYTR